MRELLTGPQSSYKPAPKSPQFCCGCFFREWASHPWYILVELRVSPSILELPKRLLRCPSQLSPPLRTVLRQSVKFSPFIPVRLASRFRVASRRSPRAVSSIVRRVAPFASRFRVALRSSRRVSSRRVSFSRVSFVACRFSSCFVFRVVRRVPPKLTHHVIVSPGFGTRHVKLQGAHLAVWRGLAHSLKKHPQQNCGVFGAGL